MKRWLLGILLLFVMITGCVFGAVWYKTASTFETMNSNISIHDLGGKEKIKQDETTTFLLMGVDSRPGDKGRTDAMMLISLNPKTDEGVMISLPRDLYVPMASTGSMDKLNHAYAFGGEEEAVRTVEDYFETSIDHVVVADMKGFQDAIDLLGGVTVNNKFSFESDNQLFPQGEQYLTGKEALTYVRMRKQDPNGDFGRQMRQREVVSAVTDSFRKNTSPLQMYEIMNLMQEHIATTIGPADVWNLVTNYHSALQKSDELEITGYSDRGNDGIYYWYADKSVINEIKQRLKHLQDN